MMTQCGNLQAQRAVDENGEIQNEYKSKKGKATFTRIIVYLCKGKEFSFPLL